MCGIAGFLDLDARRSVGDATEITRRMTTAIAHRGPDGDGVWVDAASGVALGHRRLAIIDLSPTGAQPMASASGRYTVVFNGEIYNFQSLREELLAIGHRFRGTSDTEVMLALIETHGLAEALRRMNGMFAFALWDARDRTLHLARDRMGEKPLYWAWMRGNRLLVFGSELKALRAHPDFTAPVDRAALVQYMRHAWVPGPRSILDGVSKLPAGTFVSIPSTGSLSGPTPYFSLREIAESAPDAGANASEQLETTLRAAVRRQMVADVPLGAFLSGGIDSSLVVALMQSQSTRPIRTYTIGFHERGFDEATFAARVACHLGTDHTEVYLSPADALPLVPELPQVYDEPFADSSQLPTILLSRMTRQHVTVALTGDAGDEMFAGYERYRLLRQAAHLYAVPGRKLTADAGHAVAAAISDRLPPHGRARQAVEWVRRRLDFARAGSLDDFYRTYMSTWHSPEQLVLGAREPASLLPLSPDVLRGRSPTERAMYADAMLYLPDDVLVKVDRAAMSTALETRVPFLDREVVALAWRLPLSVKVDGSKGKMIVRDILARYVPREIFERPKTGFTVPMGAWLRGPLRDWAESLLSERRLRSEGYLEPSLVRSRWEEHLAGTRDWHYALWIVLMWQAWLERYRPTA
jgi:asparagine synthase (glutamine-hydrolysing)